METPDVAFPVRHTALSLDIKGHKTDIIISSYEDHFLVMATQIGSMGTILHARKEEGVSVDPTFSVNVVFGKRDEPMLVAAARQLIEHISNSGSSKALVLSLGLRDHSSGTLKGIVSAVIEKLTEMQGNLFHPITCKKWCQIMRLNILYKHISVTDYGGWRSGSEQSKYKGSQPGTANTAKPISRSTHPPIQDATAKFQLAHTF